MEEKEESQIVKDFRTYKDKMKELAKCFDRLEELLERKRQLEKEEQEEVEKENSQDKNICE